MKWGMTRRTRRSREDTSAVSAAAKDGCEMGRNIVVPF